jgi:hypothetical protein
MVHFQPRLPLMMSQSYTDVKNTSNAYAPAVICTTLPKMAAHLAITLGSDQLTMVKRRVGEEEGCEGGGRYIRGVRNVAGG